MVKTFYFDMDGTLADFYGVENWLTYLERHQTKPYREAKPLINMKKLARKINKLQKQGYKFGIVSWLSKDNDPAYAQKVTEAKLKWLQKHCGSVTWDEIHIVPYGTPKSTVVLDPMGVLFDDEEQNIREWKGHAFYAQVFWHRWG